MERKGEVRKKEFPLSERVLTTVYCTVNDITSSCGGDDSQTNSQVPLSPLSGYYSEGTTMSCQFHLIYTLLCGLGELQPLLIKCNKVNDSGNYWWATNKGWGNCESVKC